MTLRNMSRNQAVELINELRRMNKDTPEYAETLKKLQAETDFPDVGHILWDDQSAETLAERLELHLPKPPVLSREELIELVRSIKSAEGSAAEVENRVDIFRSVCRHPSKSDLILWPNLVLEFEGRTPSVEEIVDLAMKEPAPPDDKAKSIKVKKSTKAKKPAKATKAAKAESPAAKATKAPAAKATKSPAAKAKTPAKAAAAAKAKTPGKTQKPPAKAKTPAKAAKATPAAKAKTPPAKAKAAKPTATAKKAAKKMPKTVKATLKTAKVTKPKK